MRKFARRGFARRAKPNLFWLPGGGSALFTTASTGGTLATLMKLEAPTIGTAAVTSQPVEDLTLLRLQAAIQVIVTGAGAWTLALMELTNDGISPGATMALAGDRRILWHHTYDTNPLNAIIAGFTDARWASPNYLTYNATTDGILECDPKAVNIDVKLNVRLEDGKGLYFVALEDNGTATFDMTPWWFRILARRSKG